MEEDTSTGLLALGDLELLSILDYLDVITLTKVLQSSKRMLLLAEDLMDRSPCMVSDVLPIDASAIRRHLLSRMQSKPTMCIVFNTNESEKKSAAIDQAMAAVLQSMPPTLALKYIENHSVQHGVQYYPNNDDNSVNGNDGVDKAVIMLGAFPEARTCCFMLSRRIFAAHAADIDMMLRSAGLNNPDADWKVFIITVSSSNSASFAPEFISNLQKRYPNASILGGLTSHSLIGVGSKGSFLSSSAGKGAEQACVSVLAMGGNVPLHTCVSRGVQKVSEVYDVPASDVTYYNRITRSESRDVKTDVALIGKVVGKDSGMTAAPSAAIEKALQLTRGLEGIMVGTRTLCAAAPPSLSSALSPSSNTTLDDYSGEHEDGFDLTQVHSNSVLEDGRLVHFVEESAAAPEQLQLFQMTPEACRSDIGRTLNMAKERFTRCGLEVMGCLLITCSGRGPEPNVHFFREAAVDARTLLETLGAHLPLGGYYASGEIGPAVLADQSSATVLRRGRAAIQGFTAVFGLFALPRSASALLVATPQSLGARANQSCSRRKRESGLSACNAGQLVSSTLAARRVGAVESASLPLSTQR